MARLHMGDTIAQPPTRLLTTRFQAAGGCSALPPGQTKLAPRRSNSLYDASLQPCGSSSALSGTSPSERESSMYLPLSSQRSRYAPPSNQRAAASALHQGRDAYPTRDRVTRTTPHARRAEEHLHDMIVSWTFSGATLSI